MRLFYYKGQDSVMEKLPTQAAEFQACLKSVKNIPPANDASNGAVWEALSNTDVYVLTTYYTGTVSADLDYVGVDLMWECLSGTVWTVWLTIVDHVATKITRGQRKIMGTHKKPQAKQKPQTGGELLRNTLADEYANNPMAGSDNYANNPLAAEGNYANAF
jgi:hypothetical protein